MIAVIVGTVLGWILWELTKTRWMLSEVEEEESEANTLQVVDSSLDDFLIEHLVFPLKVTVCENPCGCVMLRTSGEMVYAVSTTDTYRLPIQQ